MLYCLMVSKERIFCSSAMKAGLAALILERLLYHIQYLGKSLFAIDCRRIFSSILYILVHFRPYYTQFLRMQETSSIVTCGAPTHLGLYLFYLLSRGSYGNPSYTCVVCRAGRRLGTTAARHSTYSLTPNLAQ